MIGSEEENNSKTQDILKSNQTLKESDRLFTTMQGLGMSIKNMSKMKELGMSESTIKRKRRQLRTEGYLSRKEGSGRNRLIDEEKSYFILDLMKKNAFLSAPKIVKQLVDNYKDFNISAITVQRFLNEQGFKWKEPIVRVKNELLQRNQRLAFCNKNIDRDWSSVVFTDESSFYLHSPGISRWVPKGESNIIDLSSGACCWFSGDPVMIAGFSSTDYSIPSLSPRNTPFIRFGNGLFLFRFSLFT